MLGGEQTFARDDPQIHTGYIIIKTAYAGVGDIDVENG